MLDLPCAGGKTRLVLEHSLVPPPLLADWGATTAIAVAFIAAVGSLIATVIGQVLARRTSKDLAKRTSILEQEGKERDARRDYEYEAKKRLYEECEPLLFQTVELAENARDRIASFELMSRGQVELIARHVPDVPVPFALDAAWFVLVELTTLENVSPLCCRLPSLDVEPQASVYHSRGPPTIAL